MIIIMISAVYVNGAARTVSAIKSNCSEGNLIKKIEKKFAIKRY